MRTRTRGILKRLFIACLAILALASGAILSLPPLLASEWAISKIEKELSAALERKTSIGKIELLWGRSTILRVNDFKVANSPSLLPKEMLTVGEILLSVPVLPNIISDAEVEHFLLRDVSITISESEEGEFNWSLGASEEAGNNSSAQKSEQESAFHLPIIRRADIEKLSLAIDVPGRERAFEIRALRAENLNLEEKGTIDAQLAADSVPIELSLSLSSLSAFLNGLPLEVIARLTQQDNWLTISGDTSLRGGSALTIELEGKSLNSLSPLIGTELPSLPDFSLKTHATHSVRDGTRRITLSDLVASHSGVSLRGSLELDSKPGLTLSINSKLRSDANSLSLEGSLKDGEGVGAKFELKGTDLSKDSAFVLNSLPALKSFTVSGSIKSSDISESVKIESLTYKDGLSDLSLSGEVQFSPLVIRSDLQSESLDVPEIVNAFSLTGEPKPARSDTRKEASPATSSSPSLFAELGKTALELSLQLKSVTFLPNVTATAFDSKVKISEGSVEISEMTSDVFGGALSASLLASKEASKLKLRARSWNSTELSKISPGLAALDGSFNAAANLQSDGDNFQQILEALRGRISVSSEGVEVKSSTLSTVAKGLATILSPILEADQQSRSECMLFNFEVIDGVAHSREHVLNVDEVFIFPEGRINLPDNSLTYNANVSSSNPAFASLIPPFRVFGNLSSPYFAPSVTGSLASVTDTGEAAVGAVLGLAGSVGNFVLQIDEDESSGIEVCQKAYQAEQKLLSSQIGSLVDGNADSRRMHPSWDRDGNGINDCEDDGTCDDTIDYTTPRKSDSLETRD